MKRPKAPKSIKLDFKAINRCLAQYRREDAALSYRAQLAQDIRATLNQGTRRTR